ncbi:hypothetical protein [Dysgonomonas sp. 25]|uniref:hypothetical protein n=1 Tax=Dysgonomonas sp. 25 TaxID=2302933 RepID=UPI0013CF8628|nr:hypothetical protein [Dysgonomonas sp. 25]NDV67933.1 hypothetical protein [Dysgonomonas sp. 25]
MTNQPDLLDAFIKALNRKISKKSELVNFVADSLKIEKESASRRLNKKVYFAVSEMGILAAKLGISIDGILKHKYGSSPPTYALHQPKSVSSIDGLTNWMEADLNLLNGILNEETEYGLVFNSLPLEFVISYPNLLKFVYFKWGYYYIGSEEYNNFSSWQVPSKLLSFNEDIAKMYKKIHKITYIWDMTSIFCLSKDVEYFSHLKALSEEEVKLIRIDIHKMLHDMEKVCDGISYNHLDSDKIQIYLSTIHLGAQYSYYFSDSKCYSYFNSFFTSSNYSDDCDTCIQVRDWINSMKKVCTLISNSGAKERRFFFEEQHKIVNSI